MNMNMNVDQSVFELHQEIKHLVAVCIDGSTLGLGRRKNTKSLQTAKPERLFSKLNSTLTAIRSTMYEERLEFLLFLQVHHERTPTI